ncbi:LOW QUALITY PROTEIN: protein mono-ADP-ribosyltransferase PARP14-like [Saccoglossus kowalevskii]
MLLIRPPLTVKEPPKKRKPWMKQLPMDKKCLLIKGLADNTSKENILLFLENRTHIEEDPELLFGEEPGTVLARYQEDIPDFDMIVQRNSNVNFSKYLLFYLSYTVVNSVISRRHVINKVQLDVQPYHECLGFTVSSDGPTPRIPQPFTYTVNSDIIGFIMNNNQEEFEHLHQHLYVQVEWPHLDKSDVVLLKPNLSQDTKNLHQITKTWVNDVKSGLDKYLHSFKAVQIAVMEGIWLQVVGQLKGWSQNKDVHIIMDQSTSIINLTGKSDNVHKLESRIKSVIKDIEDEMQKAKERTSETVKINSIQARQLLMCKFSKVVQDKYPDVDVKINPKTEILSLKGLPHDILNTRVMMYEYLKDIPIIKMKPPTMSLLQYLKISEVSKRLHAEFSSAKIQAFIVLQDDEIVCSATDKVGIYKAVEIIQTSIKELRIDIKPQSMAALQKQEWRTMASGLEERQTVRISHEPNSVLIIGFETEANMVKGELQEFIQVHTIVDNLFETENGKLRFVSEYRKDDISKIQSESRITPLSIKPYYKGAVTGFLIKGTEDDVKTATVKIQKLTDDIHGRPYPVDKPGMPKLFKEEKGKNYIKLIENEIKCNIDINDPSEEIETRADEEDMEEDFEELMQDPSPTFDILCHHTIHGGRRIVVGKGDLTKMHVDVVVNAANPSLDHSGGGLTKAIVVAGWLCCLYGHSSCAKDMNRVSRQEPNPRAESTANRHPPFGQYCQLLENIYNVFIKYYLRDTQSIEEGLFRVGLVVASQTLIVDPAR